MNSSEIKIWRNARFDLILEAFTFSSTDDVSFWTKEASGVEIGRLRVNLSIFGLKLETNVVFLSISYFPERVLEQMSIINL